MQFLLHPHLVHFPVALWLTSFLFDLLYVRTRRPFFVTVSSYLVGLGLAGAILSIVAGFVDYRKLVAQGVGQAFIDRHQAHSLLGYVTTALYASIWVARWRRPAVSLPWYLGPAVVAAALIGLTGYLGGEIRNVM